MTDNFEKKVAVDGPVVNAGELGSSTFSPGQALPAVPLYARSAAESGVVTGTLVQGNALGQLLGPPVLALLVVRSGSWSGSLWFFYVLGGLGFVVAIAVRTLEKRLNEETKV